VEVGCALVALYRGCRRPGVSGAVAELALFGFMFKRAPSRLK
jgi:hypothetical protein